MGTVSQRPHFFACVTATTSLRLCHSDHIPRRHACDCRPALLCCRRTTTRRARARARRIRTRRSALPPSTASAASGAQGPVASRGSRCLARPGIKEGGRQLAGRHVQDGGAGSLLRYSARPDNVVIKRTAALNSPSPPPPPPPPLRRRRLQAPRPKLRRIGPSGRPPRRNRRPVKLVNPPVRIPATAGPGGPRRPCPRCCRQCGCQGRRSGRHVPRGTWLGRATVAPPNGPGRAKGRLLWAGPP